jgi:hypothetical protein
MGLDALHGKKEISIQVITKKIWEMAGEWWNGLMEVLTKGNGLMEFNKDSE